VTLSTAIGDLGVQLHTTYVGHPDAETAIAELFIAPGPATSTSTRSAAVGELPVSHARELCLYDLLLSLRDRLEALGYDDVAIDIPEAALASITR